MEGIFTFVFLSLDIANQWTQRDPVHLVAGPSFCLFSNEVKGREREKQEEVNLSLKMCMWFMEDEMKVDGKCE